MATFRPGDPMLLREVHLGRLWAVRPVRLVESSPERVAVFLAAGTRWLRPVGADGAPLRIQADDWSLAETGWTGNSALRVWTPGSLHSVLLWWQPVTGEFRGWYVNFEQPMRPTSLGFDYLDMALDVVVGPDRTWAWKDEDEFAEAQERGIMDASMADAIRLDADRVLDDLAAERWPFDDDTPSWRPDASWQPLGLPSELWLAGEVRSDGPTRPRS